MTPERANEIERKVIYAELNYMPYDTIDNVSAFHVGRMLGIMQKTLHDELKNEISPNVKCEEE